jgi:hypothetical protein
VTVACGARATAASFLRRSTRIATGNCYSLRWAEEGVMAHSLGSSKEWARRWNDSVSEFYSTTLKLVSGLNSV